MKSSSLRGLFILCLLAVPLALSCQLFAGDPPKTKRPNIYDESADGTKQIAEALTLAQKDGKRVLLKFGANWCVWCHRMHGLFDSDKAIAATLKNGYVVVLIDVNNEHNKAVDLKYGHPMRFGLPALVVLDATGKQLTTKDTGELEQGDHYNSDKVLAFLQEWSPKQ